MIPNNMGVLLKLAGIGAALEGNLSDRQYHC